MIRREYPPLSEGSHWLTPLDASCAGSVQVAVVRTPARDAVGAVVTMHATPQSPFSVLIADRSPVVGERFSALLAEVKGLRVLGQVFNDRQVLAQAQALRPDALVLDLRLAESDGPSLVRKLKAVAPTCVVVVLTPHSAEVFQDACRRSGADFIFDKASEFERAVETLRNLAAVAGASVVDEGERARETVTAGEKAVEAGLGHDAVMPEQASNNSPGL